MSGYSENFFIQSVEGGWTAGRIKNSAGTADDEGEVFVVSATAPSTNHDIAYVDFPCATTVTKVVICLQYSYGNYISGTKIKVRRVPFVHSAVSPAHTSSTPYVASTLLASGTIPSDATGGDVFELPLENGLGVEFNPGERIAVYGVIAVDGAAGVTTSQVSIVGMIRDITPALRIATPGPFPKSVPGGVGRLRLLS